MPLRLVSFPFSFLRSVSLSVSVNLSVCLPLSLSLFVCLRIRLSTCDLFHAVCSAHCLSSSSSPLCLSIPFHCFFLCALCFSSFIKKLSFSTQNEQNEKWLQSRVVTCWPSPCLGREQWLKSPLLSRAPGANLREGSKRQTNNSWKDRKLRCNWGNTAVVWILTSANRESQRVLWSEPFFWNLRQTYQSGIDKKKFLEYLIECHCWSVWCCCLIQIRRNSFICCHCNANVVGGDHGSVCSQALVRFLPCQGTSQLRNRHATSQTGHPHIGSTPRNMPPQRCGIRTTWHPLLTDHPTPPPNCSNTSANELAFVHLFFSPGFLLEKKVLDSTGLPCSLTSRSLSTGFLLVWNR